MRRYTRKANRNYDDPLYVKARADVKKRDKHTCKFPGCKAKRRLQVHHIKKWANAIYLRYEVGNMITLCKDHHDLVKGKEDSYAPLFYSIIRGKQNG